MLMHPQLPTPLPYGKAIILEAERGQARRTLLQHWLEEVQTNNTKTYLLVCEMEEDGPWTGLKAFLNAILPQIATKAPEIIKQHSYELAMILPEIRTTIEVQNPNLTDLSSEAERTRNWPADRAYRIVHGLIELIDAWAKLNNGERLAIACDDFDQAGVLVRLFFVELLRRRGTQHHITLIVATDVVQSMDVQQQFVADAIAHIIAAHLPVDEPVAPDPIAMQQAAEALIHEMGDDIIKREMYVPKIIRYWLASATPEKALLYQIEALSIYNIRGFYADAVVYGEAAMEQIKQYHPDDKEMFVYVSLKLCAAYMALRRPEQAFTIITYAFEKTTTPIHEIHCCYQMAMLHARFLPERDLAQAEYYLERALTAIKHADFPPDETFFQTAFHRNGIALIRHFQKRYDEAIAICKTCIDQLDRYLAPDEHKLHRSVLLYNIAQVYVAMEYYDEAVTYYTAAMEMDPNYSEYYNERGNIYLMQEQYELAVADYTKAIALSPPYAEVWTNLGQCYRLMGQLQDAVTAYSVALDIDPKQSLALFGRAEAWEALQQEDAARQDYTTLLTIDPTHVQALMRKAIDAYEEENLSLALETLNTALEHHADVTELYWNRATVFKDLGRFAEAVQDVETYLKGPLDTADRVEAEAELVTLRVHMPPKMNVYAQ